MKLSYFPVRTAGEVEAALKALPSEGIQAVVVFPDALTLDQREKIATFGLKNRIPTVSGWSSYAESGFLMTYVDKILKGAKPADLPVELPTSVEFVINTKTAKAIAIKVPQAMLVRADRVIE